MFRKIFTLVVVLAYLVTVSAGCPAKKPEGGTEPPAVEHHEGDGHDHSGHHHEGDGHDHSGDNLGAAPSTTEEG
ncbi:MAG: hypothetical protein LBQ54_08600 [Planctomycetaceae bacterium]|jgi:hypothetical protein|nr:hypothetical protein [Planctomycetaceae bacterium]